MMCTLCMQVDFCAGKGAVTRAFVGYCGKRFDEPWLHKVCHERACVGSLDLAEIRYSGNHDFMRTIGLLAVLCAVPWLHSLLQTC